MKITFLLAFSPNPRMTKRIRALKEENSIYLIYWRRHSEYLWGGSWNDVRYKEIYISSRPGEVLKRVAKTIMFATLSLKEIKRENPDCIYLQNLDMLFVAYLYKHIWRKKIKLIYEIADIHPFLIQPARTMIGKITQNSLRKFEGFLCKDIYLLVNTSEKYYERYYRKFIPESKLLVFPNVPDEKLFLNYRKKTGGIFTIGFIGAIQFKQELKLLIKAAEEIQVRVRIAGSEVGNEIELLSKNQNVYYHGKYNYDKEIAQLYSAIDCVFAVYNSEDWNVQIALPNKLYEAILCELPIIVAKNTYLSEVVEELGIGISVEHDNKDAYKNALSKLRDNPNLVEKMRDKCREAKQNYQLQRLNAELIRRICRDNKE